MDLSQPTPEQLVGWTPIRLGGRGSEPTVDWCFTEGEHFTDPFFDQTIERCLQRPFRLLFRHQTPMATLGEVAAANEQETLPLAGLVFHCSRCGSTLVSQMLAQLPSVLALAEPAALNSVLMARAAYPTVSDKERQDWLRWTVAALGQRRRREQRHLVIKMDASAVLHLPAIRKAFPATPWIFLYRDPVEVLASQIAQRGYHMIPGCVPPGLLGLDPSGPTTLPPEEYMAAVLGAMFEAVAQAADSNRSMLVNYDELPGAVAGRIAPFFGVDIDAASAGLMAEVAGRDAKNPSVIYTGDSPNKQGRATERLRNASERWAQPGYRTLEAHRASTL
jgi:gluconate kinase